MNRYPLYKKLGGSQRRAGRVRKVLSPPRLDQRTVQNDYAIPTRAVELLDSDNKSRGIFHSVQTSEGRSQSGHWVLKTLDNLASRSTDKIYIPLIFMWDILLYLQQNLLQVCVTDLIIAFTKLKIQQPSHVSEFNSKYLQELIKHLHCSIV